VHFIWKHISVYTTLTISKHFESNFVNQHIAHVTNELQSIHIPKINNKRYY